MTEIPGAPRAPKRLGTPETWWLVSWSSCSPKTSPLWLCPQGPQGPQGLCPASDSEKCLQPVWQNTSYSLAWDAKTPIFMGAPQINQQTSEKSYGLCLKMKDLPLKMALLSSIGGWKNRGFPPKKSGDAKYHIHDFALLIISKHQLIPFNPINSPWKIPIEAHENIINSH